MSALHDIVKSGKALYAGISNYSAEQARCAITTLRAMGTPMLIHQPSYSILNRTIENGLTDVLREERVGCVAFAPLQNGLLTDRYLNGIPDDSRAVHDPRFLSAKDITDDKLRRIRALAVIAGERGQTLAQMALSWVLRDSLVTSALIGASRPEQIIDNVRAVTAPAFTSEELSRIDAC